MGEAEAVAGMGSVRSIPMKHYAIRHGRGVLHEVCRKLHIELGKNTLQGVPLRQRDCIDQVIICRINGKTVALERVQRLKAEIKRFIPTMWIKAEKRSLVRFLVDLRHTDISQFLTSGSLSVLFWFRRKAVVPRQLQGASFSSNYSNSPSHQIFTNILFCLIRFRVLCCVLRTILPEIILLADFKTANTFFISTAMVGHLIHKLALVVFARLVAKAVKA